jgi:hypothetical protein
MAFMTPCFKSFCGGVGGLEPTVLVHSKSSPTKSPVELTLIQPTSLLPREKEVKSLQNFGRKRASRGELGDKI